MRLVKSVGERGQIFECLLTGKLVRHVLATPIRPAREDDEIVGLLFRVHREHRQATLWHGHAVPHDHRSEDLDAAVQAVERVPNGLAVAVVLHFYFTSF